MQTIEWLEQRTQLYRLLNALFSYPLRPEVLEIVDGLVWEDDQELPATERASNDPADTAAQLIGEGVASLRTALAAFPPSALVETGNVEYTRLFVGPGRHPVPLYASFYTGPRRLMTPQTREIQRIYAAWGLEPAAAGNVPADHLAFELAFLGALAERLSAAVRQGDPAESGRLAQAQLDFLDHHVRTWVPRVSAAITRHTTLDFFRGLALLTVGVLERDREELAAFIADTVPDEATSPVGQPRVAAAEQSLTPSLCGGGPR